MNDMRINDTGHVFDGPDAYLIGDERLPLRTTRNLARSALETLKPKVPYVGIEHDIARHIGKTMLELLDAGMVDHHESAQLPPHGFSLLSSQLLDTYQQLLFGGGPTEESFREMFSKKYERLPVSITDIRGGKWRHEDAQLIIGTVRKFCSWPDVGEDFARCVFCDDAYIQREFLRYFSWVFRPKYGGRVFLGARGKDDDDTNTTSLLVAQQGNVVQLTFHPRRVISFEPQFRFERGSVLFTGDANDSTGTSYTITRSTLTAAEVLTALQSFNHRGEGESVVLNPLERAYGKNGFMIIRHPVTKRRVVVHTDGMSSFF